MSTPLSAILSVPRISNMDDEWNACDPASTLARES